MSQLDREAGAPTLLSAERLTRFGWAIVIGLAVGFTIFIVTAEGIEAVAGGRLGGDWAPFRTAGTLAATDPQSILDPEAQYRDMAPYLRGEFAPFAYPPVLAFLFVPATWVSFNVGYVVYVLVLAGAAALAIRWTLDVIGVVTPQWRRVGMLGGMTYAGTVRSYTGAQNGTLTLLILAGGCRLLQRDDEWRAGALFGLLWFKPQFAIPVIGLLAVARRLRASAAAAAVGVLLWAANALVFGIGWVAEWSDGLLRVTDEGNRAFNTQASVSLVEYVRGRLDPPTSEVIGLGLAALLGLVFVALVWRWSSPAHLLVLTAGALLVTAPHALPYELALLVPALGLGLVARGRTGLPAAALLYAAAAPLLLPVHPFVRATYVFAVLAWGFWPTYTCSSSSRSSTSFSVTSPPSGSNRKWVKSF